MSHHDGALATPDFELELAHELPADPHAAEITRAKAAAHVDDFARASALDALDAVLAAAEAGRRVSGETVAAVDRNARLLDAEVGRFRALANRE